MKEFLDEGFLLTNDISKTLYDDYAKDMPIIDYHCHVNPKEIYENRNFKNLTQAWLMGDHYKWRLMRQLGVPERFITGDADDYEKFAHWAKSVSLAIGNPLYHWTHLELRRYMGINETLNEHSARDIWKRANAVLSQPGMCVQGIIEKSGVKLICTTDDPADSLEYHELLAKDTSFKTRVLPAWRPDKSINIEKPGFAEYVSLHADSLDGLKTWLLSRMNRFSDMGCKASDHGLDAICCTPASSAEADAIFKKVLSGGAVSAEETAKYKTHMLAFLAEEYQRRNWVMQLHFGALRNANRRMFERIGPDVGYDSVAYTSCTDELAALLDVLEYKGVLPKTIIYSLNPNDNPAIASLLSSFSQEGVMGKVQHGAAWWFNDTKRGMLEHMENLAAMSLLTGWVGMLTDSRSFLSYTRHEYFRRILCNMLGSLVHAGEYPADMNTLREVIEGICYNNAAKYFGFGI